jgi:hypothetical protein
MSVFCARTLRLAHAEPSGEPLGIANLPAESHMTDQPQNPAIHGGCLCGQVRYLILGLPLEVCRCHCQSCRKATGAAGVSWLILKASDFSFAAGQPHFYASSPGIVRGFCPNCGSSLTYVRDAQPDSIDVTVASLDAPQAFAPTAEIWLDDVLPWEQLDPAIAHHPQDSPP